MILAPSPEARKRVAKLREYRRQTIIRKRKGRGKKKNLKLPISEMEERTLLEK